MAKKRKNKGLKKFDFNVKVKVKDHKGQIQKNAQKSQKHKNKGTKEFDLDVKVKVHQGQILKNAPNG